MKKRERLRLNKQSGEPWPWSDDTILNTYKFTNVKREHDRTTRWMREHWTDPNRDAHSAEIIFNCALFRYFGTTEFAEAVGWQRRWHPERICAIARRRQQNGQRVFTGAYIVPTLGLMGPKYKIVCHKVLTPLWAESSKLAATAQATGSWRRVGEELMQLPGFGGSGFMAKEVLQDVMQTKVLRHAHDRNTWCPAGPGARRGLNRIYGRRVSVAISFGQALLEMMDLLARARSQLPKWMPELELHDVQFQLCEFDKYERVRLGEGRPRSLYRAAALYTRL